MGLDNGIVCRLRPGHKFGLMATCVFKDIDIEGAHVCYWRKCWNIRRAILDVLNVKLELGGHYELTAKDIPHIIRIIRKFMWPANWDDSQSIWLYEEILPHLIKNILALKVLYCYMRLNLCEEVYFYDSF